MNNAYHIPALLQESINGLNIKPDGVYADVTFGGSSHSREILKHLNENGRLFGFDQDIDAYHNKIDDPRFTFVHGNFRYLKRFLKYYDVERVDGILADLGLSSHHVDDRSRGFSFRFEDGELDMRMNQSAGLTAAEVLNTYTEKELADVFFLYGELYNSHSIARAVVKARANEPFKTVAQFAEVLNGLLKREKEKKDMARVFQALRIEVNKELEVLKELLEQSAEVLNGGGRLAVITYHSLEDRLVKNFMRTGNVDGKYEKDFYGNVISPFAVINNKVIIPNEEEISNNPRSRSAKLRIAEKK
ncbi:MAG: 16S rRNA (cytosine(1402)-N(4))-methyltransferase RsmH [Prevotellaceae bacterium]|jgi:16S rRNA (cytosine1402-N4)-methyltransferase|nr:16S rRNA (cytosine(1402)-N(4))-methyltransferase RsmH [Prevotellaceae bacterium]